MNEAWHTYEWGMAHKWISQGTHMNESWHTNELVMFTQSYTRAGEPARMNHSTRVNETWHKYIWVMRHATNTYESYPSGWVVAHSSQHSARAPEPVWMNHVHVCQWDMPQIYTSDTRMDEQWHAVFCNSTWDSMKKTNATHMRMSWHTYEWVMTHIWMSHGRAHIHMNESWHTYEWVMVGHTYEQVTSRSDAYLWKI